MTNNKLFADIHVYERHTGILSIAYDAIGSISSSRTGCIVSMIGIRMELCCATGWQQSAMAMLLSENGLL